ncbi:MAG: phosphoribosylamine--glycine ligase, partial [Acidimicrobiales bacterium]
VIGPEAPLVGGLADRLRGRGRLVLGPGADGARLEGSKAWMKELVSRAGVPTAEYRAFSDVDLALSHLRRQRPPYVVKTDGLAAGKGVLVTGSLAEAEADVRAKLSGVSFGTAGSVVVIEEAMAGPELSLLALCDGSRAAPLPLARDFKRLGDDDRGPNTGGMGAFAPVTDVPQGLVDEVMDRIVDPTLFALRREGIDYRGILYAGLMCTTEGPRLVEINVRLGDPEAQCVLPLLDGEALLASFSEAAAGRLRSVPRVRDGSAVCVVLAAEGYPDKPRSGAIIAGVEEAEQMDGVDVLQAGTVVDMAGRLAAAGGRVLDVVGSGSGITDARQRAYSAVERVAWPGSLWRSDIAREAGR